MLPLLLLASAQDLTVPTGTTPTMPQGPSPFSVAPEFKEVVRLALTPRVDGTLAEEEWDALGTGAVESFFQWEPGKIHFAGKLKVGQDLVASLDLLGNGWLIGGENIEVRIKWAGDKPEVYARRLDATKAEGPQWVDADALKGSTKVAASLNGDSWTVEATLEDPGWGLLPSKAGTTVGVRMDAVGTQEPLAEPFTPRVVGMLNLMMDRGSNLPAGFKWEPQFKGRSVVPGEDTRIRLTFNGTDALGFKRLDMRTEGLAKDVTSSMGVPFPPFDRKNRSFADYSTLIQPNAEPGWRILRGTLTDGSGATTIMQTCYEVASTVYFALERPKPIMTSSEPQKIRLGTIIHSNTRKRVTGVFRVAPPEGWAVDSGDNKTFVIYNARGSKRQVFEVVVPGGYKGSFPVKLTAEVGGEVINQTVWILVQG